MLPLNYFYAITFDKDLGFNYRITMTHGEFSLGSILDEGLLLFSWSPITRNQCIDVLGYDNTVEFESKASPRST